MKDKLFSYMDETMVNKSLGQREYSIFEWTDALLNIC